MLGSYYGEEEIEAAVGAIRRSMDPVEGFGFDCEEIEQFERQHKKEVAELRKAQEQLAETRKAFAKAEAQAVSDSQQAAAVMTDLRRRRRNAARDVRREKREVATAEKEITSEQRDKEVLAYELNRAIAELESLRG